MVGADGQSLATTSMLYTQQRYIDHHPKRNEDGSITGGQRSQSNEAQRLNNYNSSHLEHPDGSAPLSFAP